MHFIKYKEQELPVIIDFAVIKTICSKLSIKLSDFERLIEDPEQTEKVAFEALKRGHKLEGKEFTITEQEMEDVLGKCYGAFLQVFGICVLEMFKVDNGKKK